MRLPTKLAIVGVVLTAGTAAALFFRKTGTEKPAPTPTVAKDASLSPAGTTAVATAPAPSQGVPLPKAPQQNTAATEAAGNSVAAKETGASQLLPRLPDAFPSPKNASPPAAPAHQQPPPLPNLRGALDSPVSLPADRRPVENSTASPVAEPRPAPRPWRSHTVVDGDTLSTLAARYLGSAGRFAEILEANRSALRSADMLPIGTVLRIPPENAPPRSSALENGNRFEHLVPIPAGALTSHAAP